MLALFSLFGLLLFTSCVYFNTYYNAQKYFRQAEKARKAQERQALDLAGDTGTGRAGRDTRAGRQGASGTRKTRASRGAQALYEKAATRASAVLEKHPDSDLVDDAMFLAGRALYWRQDYTYAARSFSDLEEHFPESEYVDDARYWRGLCLEAQALEAQAREIYRGLFSSGGSGTGPKSGLRLGEMAYEQEDFVAAIEEYQATLEEFPKTDLSSEIWLRIGEANLELEEPARLDSALLAFDRALESASSDNIEYKARLNRGRVHYAKGESDAAQKAYTDLLGESKFRRFEGETRLLLGEYYEEAKTLDQALDQYERVRDDFPQTPMSAMAIYRTGVLYLREYGERARAEEYLNEVLTERRGSEAALLTQEFLADFKKVDRLVIQVHRADSLTAAEHDTDSLADSTAGGPSTMVSDLYDLPSASPDAVDFEEELELEEEEEIVHQQKKPAPIDRVMPIYPDLAAKAGVEGKVTVEVRVNEEGRVDSIGLVEGDDLFRDAARAAALQWEFEPAIQNEGPVTVWVVVPFAFELGNSPQPRDRGDAAASARQGRSRKKKADPRDEVFDNLFAVAELYRDKLALPDSAEHYYGEIERRFPRSEQLPRILYSVAWIRIEMEEDLEAARPILERLVAEYPESAHANAARVYLDLEIEVTAEELASVKYAEVERLMEAYGDSLEAYVPLLDDLAREHPMTETGAKAAYVAAWSYENVRRDTSEAERRYEEIISGFPTSSFAELTRQRQQTRDHGLIDKLERGLISIGAGLRPGERIEVVAIEPDSVDSMALSRKYLGFALRAHRRGRLDIASQMYELSLEERGRNPTALFGIGEVSWEQGYYEDAIESFAQALSFEKKMVGVSFRLFEYYLQEGREDSANKYLREFVRQDRSNPEVMDLRTEYPLFAGPEPEDLELEILKEFELSRPEAALRAPADIAPLKEQPMVRSSAKAALPTDSELDSATVIVDILISDDGLPEEIEIFDGDDRLSAAAETVAGQYVFYPAVGKDGEITRTWVELELPFARAMREEVTAAMPRQLPVTATIEPEPEAEGED